MHYVATAGPARSTWLIRHAAVVLLATTVAGLLAGVRLVSEAETSQAPFVRLADRYAIWFLLVTLVAAAGAWLLGGAARSVAVLVVATPCPLILAAPVAFVSGLSISARHGVVVKGGAVLERLANCTTLLIDKTGTLTIGRPRQQEFDLDRHQNGSGCCGQRWRITMRAYFAIVAAGPFFFVSAWLLMLFAGGFARDVGIRPFGYITSMVVTIALWLTVAPAMGAIARASRGGAKAGAKG